MAPRVAIVIYTLFGHIAQMAEAELAGIKKAGGDAKIFQIPETLPKEVLEKMKAPAKPDYPIIDPETLATYDAFLLGIPTRYGNFPAQWKTFWDATGQLWYNQALVGKYVGCFVCSGGPGGGQEMTISNAMSTFMHHGMNFVPMHFRQVFPQGVNVDELYGGSPWGAGTYSSSTNARQPTALEKEIAEIQGKTFWGVVSKVNF